MSMLSELYKVEQKNGAFGTALRKPVARQFSFDLNDLVKENNINSNVFWNFGDPNSPTNEVVSSSATSSVVEHVYSYPGNYEINSIANINGVHFHNVQNIVVDPEPQLMIWKNVTDISYWDQHQNLTFVIGAWYNVNIPVVNPIRYIRCESTTWQLDYRPSSIKVTYTGVPYLDLEILDTNGNLIMAERGIASGQAYTLDFAYHLDLLEMRFMVDGYHINPNVLSHNFSITKVELG